MNKGKIFLGVITTSVIGIIAFVHYDQRANRELMRSGVLRDIERINKKYNNENKINNHNNEDK